MTYRPNKTADEVFVPPEKLGSARVGVSLTITNRSTAWFGQVFVKIYG
jgi:hypothetical protein